MASDCITKPLHYTEILYTCICSCCVCRMVDSCVCDIIVSFHRGICTFTLAIKAVPCRAEPGRPLKIGGPTRHATARHGPRFRVFTLGIITGPVQLGSARHGYYAQCKHGIRTNNLSIQFWANSDFYLCCWYQRLVFSMRCAMPATDRMKHLTSEFIMLVWFIPHSIRWHVNPFQFNVSDLVILLIYGTCKYYGSIQCYKEIL